MKEKFYSMLLGWSIMKLVNRQKTFKARCDKLNTIINKLIDVYYDYQQGEL